MSINEIMDELLRIETKKEMKQFLESVLTKSELGAIQKRLEIVKLLKNGIKQRAIAKKLGVGIATVTRGANELKNNRFKNVA